MKKNNSLVAGFYQSFDNTFISGTCIRWYISEHTVCPGSSDPPEKKIIYICIRKLGLQRFLTNTIFKVEYYSFTEQNDFKSHELDCMK